MSETPRTDEIVRECGGVTSAWARKLETELTSARSELAHAQSNLTIRRRLCDEIQSELGVALLAGDESLTAGLAAIKGLKAELEKAKAVRNDKERRRSKAEAENRELKAQLAALQKAVGEAMGIADDAPELNPSNYDHDQVCQLNSAMVELCLFLRTLTPAAAQEQVCVEPSCGTCCFKHKDIESDPCRDCFSEIRDDRPEYVAAPVPMYQENPPCVPVVCEWVQVMPGVWSGHAGVSGSNVKPEGVCTYCGLPVRVKGGGE